MLNIHDEIFKGFTGEDNAYSRLLKQDQEEETGIKHNPADDFCECNACLRKLDEAIEDNALNHDHN